MTYISSIDYKKIADLINSIYTRVTYIDNNMGDMASVLYSSETSLDNIDKSRLYNIIRNQKTTIYNKHINSTDIRNMVKKLQDHVYANFGDVNNYLSTNGVKVFSTFAILSTEVGYPIDFNNIYAGDIS